MDKGKVVAGVLAGMAVGAALGVLFAPASGADTRKKLLRKKDDTIDGLKEKVDDLMAGLNNRLVAAKNDMANLLATHGNHAGAAVPNN